MGLFHGFDWSKWVTGTPAEKLGLLPSAQEHILAQENGKDRCLAAVRQLSQAFALAVPHEETKRIRNDVSFFQAVRSGPGETRIERTQAGGTAGTRGPPRSSPEPWRPKGWWTFSRPPVSRNQTSRCCRMSS